MPAAQYAKTFILPNDRKKLDYRQMRVVQAHIATLNGVHGRDKRLHLVENARDLHCMCGLMSAEILPHVKVSDFGRTDEFCEVCCRRLSAAEKREGK